MQPRMPWQQRDYEAQQAEGSEGTGSWSAACVLWGTRNRSLVPIQERRGRRRHNPLQLLRSLRADVRG